MKLATEKQGILSRLAKDRLGNFGVMAAFMLPVLLGAGGISIDVTRMMMTKTKLQDATDSAALAAASALANDGFTEEKARLLALQFMALQMSEGSTTEEDKSKAEVKEQELLSGTIVNIQQIATVGTGKRFTIDISSKYNMDLNPLTRLLVNDKTTLTARTTAESATESKNALSMFLVLDRSGSMSWITNEKDTSRTKCINYTEGNWGYKGITDDKNKNKIYETSPCYVNKIAALKLAVGNLMTQLNTADPKTELVRTAAVSYNDNMQTETAFNWGTNGAMTYVNALPSVPEGGTDSHGAFQKAYDKLVPADSSKETENPAHKAKNGQVPSKYIVFMTDGANTAYNGTSSDSNGNKSDKDTRTYCDKARAAKVEVFTVAFMAPTRGQTLLKYCATTEANYFQAENMTQLVAAFKSIGERATAVIARLTH